MLFQYKMRKTNVMVLGKEWDFLHSKTADLF